MLHEIFPHQFDNQFEVVDTILADDYILHYHGNQLLLNHIDGQYELPRRKMFGELPASPAFLFVINGQRCFWVEEITGDLPLNHAFEDAYLLRTLPQKDVAWAGAVGGHLKEWYTQNRYCGQCGSRTQLKADERAIECPACGHLVYPKISPAIIVAITCNDKLLLAHNTNFPPFRYSLIAGYADVGESLEQTLTREIKEEVGIDVTNVRYFASQPWPFSGSMMIGFTAQADDRQPIVVDQKEIQDAQWFQRGNLPDTPSNVSISGMMIELFEKGKL